MTHESFVQMSLFEDPKLEYYRKWDRQYDEEKAKAEDARMLAEQTIEQKIVRLQDKKRNTSDLSLQSTGTSNTLTYEGIMEMVSPF